MNARPPRRRAAFKKVPPAPRYITPWIQTPGPNGEVILKPGKPVLEAGEIGTREAGRILGLSQRRVNELCDEGIFAEGRDWWRPPGRRRAGQYHLKRAAVLRLKQGYGGARK